MSIKMEHSIFDLLPLYKYQVKHNDDHIYEHMYCNDNNDAFGSIDVICILYIECIIEFEIEAEEMGKKIDVKRMNGL